jgi:hypothetical protein
VPARILFGGLVSFAFRAVRVAAGGLTKDADQYGYGDYNDDHENEQRDYGDGHEIFPSRERMEAAGFYSPDDLYTTPQACSLYSLHISERQGGHFAFWSSALLADKS